MLNYSRIQLYFIPVHKKKLHALQEWVITKYIK